ncbi:dual specificity protein phosphatase family protein [Tuwongella immobilis]|uniref:Tyrosine specific protein phosphatases domain-containing protein n=1 Tax=Tuwongella immobilis TaxID=692036 RepID=A0A6C2YVQ2_9BACT
MRLDAERLYAIEPGLFQSSRPGLYPPPGVSVVLNVSDTANDFVVGHGLTAILHLPMADHQFPGVEWLEMAVDLLHSFRQRGHSVLVHCDMAESRSSMVLLGYRMRTQGIGLESALAALVRCNPHADPNHHFLAGLRECERAWGLSPAAAPTADADAPAAATGQQSS